MSWAKQHPGGKASARQARPRDVCRRGVDRMKCNILLCIAGVSSTSTQATNMPGVGEIGVAVGAVVGHRQASLPHPHRRSAPFASDCLPLGRAAGFYLLRCADLQRVRGAPARGSPVIAKLHCRNARAGSPRHPLGRHPSREIPLSGDTLLGRHPSGETPALGGARLGPPPGAARKRTEDRQPIHGFHCSTIR